MVRKTWNDVKSQIGAYAQLDNAKKARDTAGADYEVYDFNNGDLIYPNAPGSEDFQVGDAVRIISGAIWSTGSAVPKWLLPKTLYVRQIKSNGTIVVSTLKTGAVTGVIKPEYLDKISSASSTTVSTPTSKPDFKNYLIIVIADSLNVRNGAGTQYKVNTTIKKG